MTKKKNLKAALVTAILSLVVCLAMFAGTTYAWFTDSVTSSNNIIAAGTLNVEMEYKNKISDSTEAWKDASKNAIFSHKNWEPGYTEVKYVKVSNEGSLAFMYKINIYPNIVPTDGEVNLSDVIDVYIVDVEDDESQSVDKDDLVSENYKDTMTKIMKSDESIYNGTLESNEANIIAIVLKMNDDAGNKYMGLSAGDGFTVQLLASQYSSEADSFDNTYDSGAEYDGLPMAIVSKAPQFVGEGKIADDDWNSMGNVKPANNNVVPLETAYTFATPETYEEAQKSEYAKWHADFVVSVDADVPANSIMIAGNYGDYGWVGFTNEGEAITEGTKVRLLDLADVSMSYEELCNLVQTFSCGAADYRDALAGATMTVELRLYEVEKPSEENNNSWNVETGNYEVIGKYSYTFEGPEENPMATVTAFTAQEIADVQTKVDNNETTILSGSFGLPVVNTEDVEVKALYSFVANDTAATIEENEYKDWKVDFAVVFNKDVPVGTIGLLGEYGTYGWVGFGIPDVNDADSVDGVAAEDSVLVLETACDILGLSPNNWTYKDICEQVAVFNCGVFVNQAMADQIEDGTTVAVELRLYNPVNTEMYVVANYVVYTF